MKRVLPFLLTYIVSLMSVSCVDEISDSSLLMQEMTFTAMSMHLQMMANMILEMNSQ